MRQIILIFTIGLFLITSCKVFKNEKNTNMTNSENKNDNKFLIKEKRYVIASYNVENLFDTINDPDTKDDEFTPKGFKHWTKERYEKKLNDLSWVLSHIFDDLPTLISLCEIEHKSVVKDLANTDLLKNGKYKVVHEEGPDIRGIDVAFMYRSDLFHVISHEVIPVIIPS